MKKITLLTLALVSFLFGKAQTTQTFNYTGAVQTFTIPANVFSITVDVKGGAGGDATNLSTSPATGSGGLGGRVQGTISVNPGDILNIYVGGVGTSDGSALTCIVAAGGYNGGGKGYGGYNSYNYNAGGGGGASDIRLNGTSLAQRIFVAGGGGGGACSGCTGAGIDGGLGGGLIGGDGTMSTCSNNLNNGKGGTQVGGGLPGAWAGGCTNADTGSLGMGGRGQDSASCSGGVTCGSGGGGGAGYYGGGGGGNGGGGGGSSYSTSAATGVVHTAGTQAGNGQVVLTYIISGNAVHTLNAINDMVSIYPNPFTDNINVKIDSQNSKAEIYILNMLGENVLSLTSNKAQTQINLSQLNSGIYFVKVQLPEAIYVQKVIKK